MLDQYIGECMISTININNGIREPTMGIKFVILVKYLVGMSRLENICIPKLLFRSIQFSTILILQLYLSMNVLAWYIYPNGIKSKNIIKNPYLILIKM